MTAVPGDVARRLPAQVATIRPNRKVINGHTVTRRHPGRIVGWTFFLLLMSTLFAGFLLSMLQQHG